LKVKELTDSIRRFSSRVDDYIKYRPTYPPAVVRLLADECRLTTDSIIADVGSGTGILSEMWLRHGSRVFGIEPNREMRAAAERLLQNYAHFASVDATAETTTLADRSVDFVTAGQAFHWFDAERARREFARILKPDGWVVLMWNERRTDTTPFLVAYEELLQTFGTDYREVNHAQIETRSINSFFAPSRFKLATFDNEQVFDLEGLQGRLQSASYTPQAGHPNHGPMLERLHVIFEQHQVHGRVTVEYDTKVYYGHVSTRDVVG